MRNYDEVHSTLDGRDDDRPVYCDIYHMGGYMHVYADRVNRLPKWIHYTNDGQTFVSYYGSGLDHPLELKK